MSAVAESLRFEVYTPTLRASVTSPSLGTGAISAGRWARDNDAVTAVGRVVFGTGCTAGEGTFRLELPVRAASAEAWEDQLAGHGFVVQASTGNRYALQWRTVGMDPTQVVADSYEAGLVSARELTDSTPWVWAVGDVLTFRLQFEAAWS